MAKIPKKIIDMKALLEKAPRLPASLTGKPPVTSPTSLNAGLQILPPGMSPVKPPIPLTIQIPSPPTKKPLSEYQNADAGNALIPRYNTTESVVQDAEFIHTVGSNLGFAAGQFEKFLPTIAKVVPTALKVAPTIAKVAGWGSRIAPPAQAALYGVDAARAVFDPRYREESLKATNTLLDDPTQSTALKSVQVALNALARPTSAVGSQIRSYADASSRIRSAEEEYRQNEGRAAEGPARVKERKRKQDVAEVQKYLSDEAKKIPLPKPPPMDRLSPADLMRASRRTKP